MNCCYRVTGTAADARQTAGAAGNAARTRELAAGAATDAREAALAARTAARTLVLAAGATVAVGVAATAARVVLDDRRASELGRSSQVQRQKCQRLPQAQR